MGKDSSQRPQPFTGPSQLTSRLARAFTQARTGATKDIDLESRPVSQPPQAEKAPATESQVDAGPQPTAEVTLHPPATSAAYPPPSPVSFKGFEDGECCLGPYCRFECSYVADCDRYMSLERQRDRWNVQSMIRSESIEWNP